MWTIDFESSGLSRESYPLEVGVTNGSVEYQAYIHPMDHWTYWDKEAEIIHGISKEKLFREGKSASTVADQLNRLLKSQTVYCDSVRWDSFWANVLFSDNGIHCKFEIKDVTDYISSSCIDVDFFVNRRNRLIQSGFFKLHTALGDAKLLHSAIFDGS